MEVPFAVLVAAGCVCGVLVWSTLRVLAAMRDLRQDTSRDRSIDLLRLLVPGVMAVNEDPRALLVWQPVAATARRLFPAEFAGLDRAWGRAFPFSDDEIQAAHARWTASWLAWEVAHDAEYKARAAVLEQQLGEQASSPAGRARLEATAREKLDRYQKHYEDYTRVSRALRTLTEAR